MNVRRTALSILREAAEKEQYISLALSGVLQHTDLDARDRAFLTALCYGVTEKRVALDYEIDRRTDRPVGARMRMLLRLGLYQLRYTRVPAHAAIAETVKLGKSAGERAFLTGVLRAAEREGTPPPPADPTERLAVTYSFPTEVVRLLTENLGEDAERTLQALSTPAPMTIAVNTLRQTREAALEALLAAGYDAHACTASPRGIRIFGNVTFASLCDLLGEDGFFVQDEASQIALAALDPKPGMRGVDVCAAPGSKSFHAALAMENRGAIDCFDLHESKLPLIRDGAARLHLDILTAAAHDSTAPVEALCGKCDFVLCDVPCSGLGVMAKKPEIRFHAAESAKELAPLGYKILSASANYLKIGGRMLFSTCTLTNAENGDNYHRFLAAHPNFAPIDFAVGDVQSQNGCVTLLPNGERDGFFIGLIERKG